VPSTVVPSEYNKSYKFKSKTAQNFIKKHLTDDPEVYRYAFMKWAEDKVTFDKLKELSDKFNLGFPDYVGIKKNYIKFVWNSDKKIYQIKAKGKFVKRDRTKLEKEFQQKYIKLWCDSPQKAEEYYNEVLTMIISGKCDPEYLTVTRKIRIGEKKLVDLGFGVAADTVSFYKGADGEYVQSGAYSVSFYLDKLQRMYEQLHALMNHTLPNLEEDC
jgi:uncharacterized ubiquitin-like protein YukD